MRWVEIIAENRIQEAIERGEFEDLPGKGKPLNLDEYFSLPVGDRMAVSLLKNAGVLPPEVELLREIEALNAAIARCTVEKERYDLRRQIQTWSVSLNMALERRSGRGN